MSRSQLPSPLPHTSISLVSLTPTPPAWYEPRETQWFILQRTRVETFQQCPVDHSDVGTEHTLQHHLPTGSVAKTDRKAHIYIPVSNRRITTDIDTETLERRISNTSWSVQQCVLLLNTSYSLKLPAVFLFLFFVCYQPKFNSIGSFSVFERHLPMSNTAQLVFKVVCIIKK